MLEPVKTNRARGKRKVVRTRGEAKVRGARGGLGLLLAIAFIVFGIVNLVHPLELTVFQATCGKPMFFSCWDPSQKLSPFGARVVGFLSLLLGAALGWLSLFWPRK